MVITAKGQVKNAVRGKKNRRAAARLLYAAVCLMACVVFFAGMAGAAPSSLPYAMEAFFCRMDAEQAATLPGDDANRTAPRLCLAVTLTPREHGLYVYGSKSQATGKVSEISATTASGEPLGARIIFPRGAEKPDPLNPGKTIKGYAGTFTALVPVTARDLSGGDARLRFTGLACSDKNCTPLDLAQHVAVPPNIAAGDAAALAALPDAASFPWWSALRTGVVETMPEITPGLSAGKSSAMPLIPATGAFGAKPLVPAKDDAFLERIVPRPFSPALEVSSLGKAVLFGFLAGIILNLMPCVLPVLGIKIGALLRGGERTPEALRLFRRHQAFFALGVMAWFTALAGLFHFLDLAWGQLFQSPAVVFGLAALLLLLALNMFGVLSLPLINLRAANPKNPDAEAFACGFAATLLATPCGGPLLGGVLSWALMQPLGVMALTLESVGLGMASPYLLLAVFPGVASRLPRPGAWMGTLERVLGFLLLATVAYLVSFLPGYILSRAGMALVLVAFGGWVWGESGKSRRAAWRVVSRLAAVALIVFACVWPLRDQGADDAVWTPYSAQAFSAVLGKRIILVDFTADWCPTCKVVEATALTDDTVRQWRRRYNAALFRVDLTRDNPAGQALLRAVGSVSIPVVAVFGTGENALAPLVLRDVVTRGQVEQALDQASGGSRKDPGP